MGSNYVNCKTYEFNEKRGRPPIYPTELKIVIAREYITSSLGYGKLALKHNLNNAATVRSIVKWYRSTYPDVRSEPTNEDPVPEVPASVIDKQLKEANLKIMALELLIANASKELGVDIVKKLGTKQSPK